MMAVMSMTGYGRGKRIIGSIDILVEIKSVNHRYFEYTVKTPRGYGYLDDKLKTLVANKISRGKVEVNVSIYTIDVADGKNQKVSINKSLVLEYVNALRELKGEFHLRDELSLDSLLRINDIFTVSREQEDEEKITDEVLSVAQEALTQFLDMRKNEGEILCADIKKKLETVSDMVLKIEEKAPESVTVYKEKLLAKITEILASNNFDRSRILTEVAIFAEKIAVDEETVRLNSHLNQFSSLLLESTENNCAGVGRRLDFLVQEINREINTIGSKCQDISVAAFVIELKSEIEKIREQIQNIE